MSNLAEKISHDISEAIEADELVLPTMPEMALRVREVAENPNSSVKQLASVIAGDAALTARLIKVANSALYKGAQDIKDLSMAMARLGLTTTCTLATGLAMSQMFQATTDMVDKRLRAVWATSGEIAGLCTLICKKYTRMRPDQATLAGLIHKIGILPILSYVEDNPGILKDSFTLDVIIKSTHPVIGQKILQAWEFPPELQIVPRAHLVLDRKPAHADFADLVTLSLFEINPESTAVTGGGPTAYERLGIEPGTLAQTLGEEMLAARQMFK